MTTAQLGFAVVVWLPWRKCSCNRTVQSKKESSFVFSCYGLPQLAQERFRYRIQAFLASLLSTDSQPVRFELKLVFPVLNNVYKCSASVNFNSDIIRDMTLITSCDWQAVTLAPGDALIYDSRWEALHVSVPLSMSSFHTCEHEGMNWSGCYTALQQIDGMIVTGRHLTLLLLCKNEMPCSQRIKQSPLYPEIISFSF